MKEHSHLTKIISILMIFILLIQLTGCYTTRVIPRSELNDSTGFDYVIHGKKSKYLLENTEISDGILYGKINLKYHTGKKQILIYPSSDSIMKINSENILSIPLDNIAKVEKRKLSALKVTLLSVGSAIGFLYLIAAISLAINGMDIHIEM
jgi:hypothetical protein